MIDDAIYTITAPRQPSLPILVSVPHSGTEIPKDILAQMDPNIARRLPDTDWFVHQLYDFVPEMGATLIHARFSRYVVDLNRDSDGSNLYGDGRRETALVPTETFSGEPIYSQSKPSPEEIERRKRAYYFPYYEAIRSELEAMKSRFSHVLFFDAHSIRSFLPSISPEKFPDLILGNQDGRTCHPLLFDAVVKTLTKGPYRVSANVPFKGGHLTRFFGDPENRIHSMQLEMCQNIYMDEKSTSYLLERANRVRELLREVFVRLKSRLEDLA